MNRFILTLFAAFAPLLSIAQEGWSMSYLYEMAGMAGSGDNAPFWHTSNRQGLPSAKNTNGYMHVAALGNLERSNGLGLDYGLDVGMGRGLQSDLYVHQLYLDAQYKFLGLSMGMKERYSDKNPNLSSGSLTWSGNSRPIPELRLGIPEFVRVPVLGNWFSIKGHLGYGRMTDDSWRRNHASGGLTYTDGILFHTKDAYIRFGQEERFPLLVTLGLEMNNMFGGTRHRAGTDQDLPSNAAAYWTVLFPFHHVENQGNEDGDNLGSWHLNFDYILNDWHIGAYYEHFYEDHSSMLGIEYKNDTRGNKNFVFFGFRRNWFDGLFGIEVNAPKGIPFFSNAVVEFLNTRGLCGPICHSAACNFDGMNVIEEVDGRDGMYNHGIYDSYSLYGYAIGNPVLISPVYNKTGGARFRSNRVQMMHLGVDGSITRSIDYRLLATSTLHWGQYGAPLAEVARVSSLMLECSYQPGDSYGWKFSLSGAMDFDTSDLLGNNKGVMLKISKVWKAL